MNLRSISLIAVIVAFVLAVTGCTVVKPGTVGVKVYNLGETRGVQDLPTTTGLTWYNPMTTDIHVFPTSQQTVKWTAAKEEGSEANESISFSSGVDRVPINADIGVSVAFAVDKVPHIFAKYRQDAAVLVDGRIRNEVRDEFGRIAATYTAGEIVAQKRGEFLDKVKEGLNARLLAEGFVFDSVTFLSDPRIPDNIRNAINDANAAAQYAQKSQYLIQVKEAEGKQRIAAAQADAEALRISADAQAYAQSKIASATTPAIIELKRIEKWNGELPQVSGGSTPFVSLGVK